MAHKAQVKLVLTCEHASWELPPGYGSLGLDSAQLQTHCSYDPGAATLVKALAARFGLHPFLGGYSRLLVDLNRGPDHSDVVPKNSFGLEVPGNRNLSPEERQRRLQQYHSPYRQAVEDAVGAIISAGHICMLVSIHSFTPNLDGQTRDKHIGVLFDPALALETKIAVAMLATVRGAGLRAQANYPYSGIDTGLYIDMRQQFDPEKYAGLEFEVRQSELVAERDLIHMTSTLQQALQAGLKASISP